MVSNDNEEMVMYWIGVRLNVNFRGFGSMIGSLK